MRQRDQDISSRFLLRAVQINRYRDILIFIPILAGVVFLSPILDLVQNSVYIFGIPARLLQIFLIWLLLILALRRTNHLMLKKLNEREL